MTKLSNIWAYGVHSYSIHLNRCAHVCAYTCLCICMYVHTHYRHMYMWMYGHEYMQICEDKCGLQRHAYIQGYIIHVYIHVYMYISAGTWYICTFIRKIISAHLVYSEFEICVFVIILDYVLEAQTCWVTCYYFKFSISRQRRLVFVYAKKHLIYFALSFHRNVCSY